MYKLSIIIPIYNVEKYLRECLMSLTGQTNQDFEVILVNDGSTDGSSEIVSQYKQEHENVKVIEQENKGLSEARNAGLKVATGEYLLFLDSDDWLDEKTVEVLVKIVYERELDLLLFGGRKRTISEKKIVNEEHFGYKHNNLEFKTGLELYHYLHTQEDYSSCVVLQCIKRTLLENCNLSFYPGILHEDHLYTFQVLMNAKKCGVVSEELYLYRIREGSITTSNKGYALNFKGMSISFREMVEWYIEHQEEIRKYKGSVIKHIKDMKLWTQWYYNSLTEQERNDVSDEKKLYDITWKKLKTIYDCKVSVIIPAYNVEKYIDACIKSILSQRFSNLEVIIIDDGSTDGTANIVRRYVKECKFKVSLYEQVNLGPSKARNLGLDVALGEYILYVDSDDYINENTIERLLQIIEQREYDSLLFSCKKIFMDGDVISSEGHWGYDKDDLSGKSGIQIMAELLPTKSLYDVVWLQFVKSSLIEENQIRFYPGIIHEDHLYTFTVLLNSKKSGYISEELYNYRVREKSIMTTDGRDHERFKGWVVTFNELGMMYTKQRLRKRFPQYDKVIRDYIWFCGEFALNLYYKRDKKQKKSEYSEYYKQFIVHFIRFCRLQEVRKLIVYQLHRCYYFVADLVHRGR